MSWRVWSGATMTFFGSTTFGWPFRFDAGGAEEWSSEVPEAGSERSDGNRKTGAEEQVSTGGLGYSRKACRFAMRSRKKTCFERKQLTQTSG
jgi:hypothetical protein